jgi:glycine/D-amino acid oxidase-like deaminating enzyme
MNAPTTSQEIKSAYKALYTATANAMDAQRTVNASRAALKDAEAVLMTSGSERTELRRAEDALAATEREQTLAKIVVNELHTLLRLAEWESGQPYFAED